jgi:hypothetical protein
MHIGVMLLFAGSCMLVANWATLSLYLTMRGAPGVHEGVFGIRFLEQLCFQLQFLLPFLVIQVGLNKELVVAPDFWSVIA